MDKVTKSVTITGKGPQGDFVETTEEAASLDSYKMSTNAKGEVVFEVKIYTHADLDHEKAARELGLRLSHMRKTAKDLGFTVAGEKP